MTEIYTIWCHKCGAPINAFAKTPMPTNCEKCEEVMPQVNDKHITIAEELLNLMQYDDGSEAADYKLSEQITAIIAKHFPSPVAAEGDVEKIVDSVIKSYGREHATYVADGSPKFQRNMLIEVARAALSAQPASVGGVGEAKYPKIATVGEWGWKSFEDGPLQGHTSIRIPTRPGGWQHIIELDWEDYDTDGKGRQDAEEIAAYIVAKVNSPTAIEPQAGWRDASTYLDNYGPVLVLKSSRKTGESLGYDIAWREDGDWMYASMDNDPHRGYVVTHWQSLPQPPANRRE